jgi:nitroreductase
MVPRKKIGKILEAGRQAPSPGNVQSLEFIIVEDHHKKEVLGNATGDERVVDAPTSVIIVADVDRMARRIGEDHSFGACSAEAAVAVQNMRLVAAENNVQSCWMSGFDRPMVANGFEIPEGREPLFIACFGYSNDLYDREDRFGMNSVVYYDEYDNQIDSLFDSLEWKGVRENRENLERRSRRLQSRLRQIFEDIL